MSTRMWRPSRLILIAFGPGAVLLLNGCGGRLSQSGASAGAGQESGAAGSTDGGGTNWPGTAAGAGRTSDLSSGGLGGASGSARAGSGGVSGLPEAGSSGRSFGVGGDGGVAGDGGAANTVFYGPDGTTITSSLAAAELTVDTSCADIPPGLFDPQFAPCLRVSASAALIGTARVCFRNPTPSPGPTTGHRIFVVLCTSPLPGLLSCAEPSRLFAGKCCLPLGPGARASDAAVCGDSDRFETFAAGSLTDTDHDFAPDIDDNCRFAQNPPQSDADHDAVGNACDNCATAYNPDQTDTNHDGIGDACEAASGAAGAGGAVGSP